MNRIPPLAILMGCLLPAAIATAQTDDATVDVIGVKAKLRRDRWTSTLLRVHRQQPTVLAEQGEFDEREFTIFRQTQAQLLVSHFVLESALRPQEVAVIPAIRNADDPIEWLRNRIEATFPENGEIFEVRLYDNKLRPEHLRTILDSVRASYIREAVDHDGNERTRTRELLRDQYNVAAEKLHSDRMRYASLMRQLDGGTPQQLEIERTLLLEGYRRNRNRRADLQDRMAEAFLAMRHALVDLGLVRLNDAERRTQNDASETAGDAKQDEQIHPSILYPKLPLAGGMDWNAEKPAKEAIDKANRMWLKYQMTRYTIANQVAKLDEEAVKIERELADFSSPNADLEDSQQQLQRRSVLVDAMAQRLQLMNIEQFAGAQIQAIQPAVIERGE